MKSAIVQSEEKARLVVSLYEEKHAAPLARTDERLLAPYFLIS